MRGVLTVLLVSSCSLHGGYNLVDVDFMGSTLQHFDMKNGVESDCQLACDNKEECVAYTFGTARAPVGRRGMCYLKKEGFKYKKSRGYNSGFKP